MAFDEIMTLAAAELNCAMITSISPLASESHCFSANFERKMRTLIRKTNHPRTYSFLCTAASVSIVLLLSFVITITFSTTARAVVINWIKEYCAPYIEYIIPESQHKELSNYHISALPAEYIELSRTNTGDSCIVIYEDSQGQQIHLIYSKNPNEGHLFVIGEESTSVEVIISGYTADLYIPQNANEKLSLVWYDTTRHTLFYISAQISQSELVYYAESIK